MDSGGGGGGGRGAGCSFQNLDMEIKGIKAKGIKAKLFQCPYTLLYKWMSKEMKSKGEIPDLLEIRK
jgi:hypothetical protein